MFVCLYMYKYFYFILNYKLIYKIKRDLGYQYISRLKTYGTDRKTVT